MKTTAALILLLLALMAPLVSYGDAGVESFWDTAYDTDYYVEVSAGDGGANLRDGAGADYAKCISDMMPNGTVLHITRVATADNGKKWGMTEYKGISGWVALSQTKTTSAPSSGGAAEPESPLSDSGPAATLASAATAVDYNVKVAAPDGGVNFRCGPGKSYAKIINSLIPNGTRLHISGEGKASNGKTWGLTEYNGQLGWIFLGETEKVSAASAKPEKNTQPAQSETAPAETNENAEQPAAEASQGTNAAPSADDGTLTIRTNTLLKAALAVLGLLVLLLLVTVILLIRKRKHPTMGRYGQDMYNSIRPDEEPDRRRDYRDPWER